MHQHVTPRPESLDPRAARIAELSEEYITASAERRESIGAEIAGLIAGKVVPIAMAHLA